MAHFAADRLAGKTQKVKLRIDQKIRGVGLSKGDTADLPLNEALYLKNIDRVEFVETSEPKSATR
jgi:hypothetical protein